MSKPTIIKRIEKLERLSTDPRWKVAIYDERFKTYSGPDFKGSLTPEQFKKWYAAQGKDTQVIIVEILENKPKLIIENYASKNTEDLLKEYEQVIKKITDQTINQATKNQGEEPCQESSTLPD